VDVAPALEYTFAFRSRLHNRKVLCGVILAALRQELAASGPRVELKVSLFITQAAMAPKDSRVRVCAVLSGLTGSG
jgi:hypothetical protein